MYSMFLDDERFPPQKNQMGEWVIVRTLDEVKNCVNKMGFPSFVLFDHDLGDNQPTGMDVAKWLVEWDMDHEDMPADFDFYVHSQNLVGVRNIQSYLAGYFKIKGI